MPTNACQIKKQQQKNPDILSTVFQDSMKCLRASLLAQLVKNPPELGTFNNTDCAQMHRILLSNLDNRVRGFPHFLALLVMSTLS